MQLNVLGRILPDSTPGSFIWRVEHFTLPSHDTGLYCIGSPTFFALGGRWRLLLSNCVGINGGSITELSLCALPPVVVARFEFGFRGRVGTEPIACCGQTEIMVRLHYVGQWGIVRLPLFWQQCREEFIPGDVLSVFCRIKDMEAPRRPSATPGNDTSKETEDLGQVSQNCEDGPSKSCNSPGAHKVVENLKELLSSEEASDVTLKVRNQELKAHKALLLARSSVFRAMFSHEMSENLSNEVHITDCDPDAFRIFLRHVYTGDAEGLSGSNVFDVFFVADKYDAAELKIQCNDCIASNITVENFCDVVAFSLLHSESVLLEMASEFFTKYISQILPTNKWQCFFREHSTTANELITKASKYYYPP